MSIDQPTAFADTDYEMFKRKVKASYSLDLDAYKRPQMERRLRANMDKCGAQTFQQYYALMQKSPSLAEEFLDRVTINVSELFRNPEQFDVLRASVLPGLLAKSGDLHIWSAGCSYGAEPYTIALLLQELAPRGRHNILATDIDDRMLARANRGVFQEHEIRNVTRSRLAKHFTRTESGYEVDPSLKSMITFRKHDLLKDSYRVGMDLIVCRNVVIYFTDEAKAALYRRFYQSLRPGGYLFVGGTERVTDYIEIGFESAFPFFYRKPERH